MSQEIGSEEPSSNMGSGSAEYANLQPVPKTAETSRPRAEAIGHATQQGETHLQDLAQRGDYSPQGLAEARARVDAAGNSAGEKFDEDERFVTETATRTTDTVQRFQTNPSADGLGRVDLDDPTNPKLELFNFSLLQADDEGQVGRILDQVYGSLGAVEARNKAGIQDSAARDGQMGFDVQRRITRLDESTFLTESTINPVNGQPGARHVSLEVSKHIQ